MNINDSHQDFRKYDDQQQLICAWTLDKIMRKTGPVWVMNHFFLNPAYEAQRQQILDQEMATAQTLAQESHLPIWPLDPQIIAYARQHPDFAAICCQLPAEN
jgi:hypothetical protein